MAILNYTTKIDADKTIMEIQKMLAKVGAKAILANYNDEGIITALSFQIDFKGQLVGFKLPCNPEPVLLILDRDSKVPRGLKTNEQALRVAWRIVKNWTEAQLAIIETKMVEPEQVFLPYAVTSNGQTVYEQFNNDNSYLLGGK